MPCNLASQLIYAYAVKLFTSGAREREEKKETSDVESCYPSFKNELKWCYNWLVWLAVIYMLGGSVIPHTPLISFPLPLSICSAFLCANVYARFMAPKDKERHFSLCDVASRPHKQSPNSEGQIWRHFYNMCGSLMSFWRFTLRKETRLSGAHRWVRSPRCQ